MALDTPNRVAIVVIGRNEGERLVRCLASLPDPTAAVYVDSGSTDGSVEAARRAGAAVVELDMTMPFTAARARNAGVAALAARDPLPRYVQMIDGDCELIPGWIESAAAAMDAEPALFAIFGRLHERHPERSLYNAMCDEEWDVPVGLVRACGGIAMIRADAFRDVGGYDPALIAGEEPDLCWRAAAEGWRIRRIAPAMARHDAAITRFGQAHRRAVRAGHAYAELVWRHGDDADPDWRRAVISTLLWGLVLPVAGLIGLLLGLIWSPALLAPLAIVALFAAQWVRIYRSKRADHGPVYARGAATVLLATKLSQARGLVRFHTNRLRGRKAGLIEYKSAPT